jgi:hypothetical protein
MISHLFQAMGNLSFWCFDTGLSPVLGCRRIGGVVSVEKISFPEATRRPGEASKQSVQNGLHRVSSIEI